MGADNMWPEVKPRKSWLSENETSNWADVNIKLVTHVSRKYVWIFDGQIKWRKRIK